MYSRSAFLYTGPDAAQTGVSPGAIDPDAAAVVRGTVTTASDGKPYGGATISIADHPEWGHTTTDSTGSYSLAVNGGSLLTVQADATGMLTVQRSVSVDAGQFEQVDPIALTALSPTVGHVSLAGPTSTLVSLGTSPDDGCTDSTGNPVACPRTNALYVPSGTLATAVGADGTETPLSGSVGVRATEYTVGDDGPAAMPGTLPSSSAYTYAVDLTLDQAQNAATVRFTDSAGHPQTLYNYVTDFLQFPVGTHVPSAYYDHGSGQWVGSTDGIVIKVLAISGGVASVDSDGDGVADTGPATAPFSSDELATLGATYHAGDLLWRVPITHFTPWDYNFPYGCKTVCKPAKLKPYHDPRYPDPCESAGSIIGCENQSLGERIPLADTPYQLAYDSSTTKGYTYGRHVRVPLASVIPDIADDGYVVSLSVAGQVITKSSSAPPAAGAVWDVTWDGKDAFGHPVYGPVTATITAAARYHLYYKATSEDLESTWAEWPVDGDTIGVQRDTSTAAFSSTSTVTLDGGSPPGTSLGDWGIDAVAHYDAGSGTETFGDGTTRHVRAVGDLITALTKVDDSGCHYDSATDTESCGDGGPASAAQVYTSEMAMGPDGSVYFYDENENRIRKMAPTGDRTITAFAGNGKSCPYSSDPNTPDPPCLGADGESALDQPIPEVSALAVGPDGTVYGISGFDTDTNAGYIFAVSPSGKFRIVAGNGQACDPNADPTCGGGQPADQAPVEPMELAATSAGVYFYEIRNETLQVVTPDGILHQAYGCNFWGDGCHGDTDITDGVSAAHVEIGYVLGLAAGQDGSLWLTGTADHQVVQIDPAGIIHLWGTADGCDAQADPSCGDGGPASQASFTDPWSITVDNSGTVHVLDEEGNGLVVRAFRPGGTIERELGSTDWDTVGIDSPAGGGALTTPVFPYVFAALPSGELVFDDFFAAQDGLFSINGALSTAFTGATQVPSADGSQYLDFDAAGRETAAHDALTGAVVLKLGYDDAGRLVKLTDVHGGVTTIQRAADGTPTAVVAPSGATTHLTVAADGTLTSVQQPTGETATMTYGSGGLLATFTDFGGGHHGFTYDGTGRLTSDKNANGKIQTLSCQQSGGAACTGDATSQTVTVTSPTGKATTYTVAQNDDGTVTRSQVEPSGATTTVTTSADGRQITTTSPKGTETEEFAPDPRFGLAAPYLSSDTLTRPDGSTDETTTTRLASFADPHDPYSTTDLETTTTRNGKTTSYDWTWEPGSHTGTLKQTSPEGRVSTTVVNALDEPTSVSATGGTATTYTYDAHGHALTAKVGTATSTWTYDASGHLATATSPGGMTTTYGYDADGRIHQVTDDSGKTWTATYDGNGVMTSYATPLGGTFHATADGEGALTGLTLPGAAAANTKSYDADGHYTGLALADGASLTRTIGATGLLTGTSGAGVTTSYAQHAGTDAFDDESWTAGAGAGGGTARLQLTHNGLTPTAATFSGAVAGTLTATLDADGRTTGLAVHTAAGDDSVDRAFDDDGLLTKEGPFTLSRTGPAGATASVTDGTATFGQTVAGDGDVTDRTLTIGGTQLFHESLQVSGGQVTSTTTGGTTTSYAYDADGRLKQAGATTYSYDADGNLLDPAAGAATYDSGDRLLGTGATPVTVDDAGRLVARGADTYAYDAEGELVRAVVGGVTATYTYDAQGRRVAETTPAGTTGYLYGDPAAPSRVSAVREADGHTDVLLYDDRGMLLGFRRDGSTLFYVGTDHLGSPRVVAKADGTVVQRLDYDAWGNVTHQDSTTFATPLGYAGGLADPATGLVHFGLRDYSPALGRFTVMDRVLFAGGRNLYQYAGDDPVSARDPLGTWGVAGSAYGGVGGGGAVNVDGQGWSICAEVGFGLGESVEVNSDPPASTGVTVGAEATAKAGPMAVTVGASASAGPCTPYSESVGVKGTLGPANLQVGISNAISPTNPNGDWTSATPTVSRATPPEGEGAEGKVYAKGCVGGSW